MRWHYTEQEKPLQSCDCIIKTKKGVMFAFFEEFFYATNDGRGRLIEDVLLQDEDVLAWESIEAVSDFLDTIEFGRMIINQRDRTECKGVEVKSDPAQIYPFWCRG